MERFFKQYLEKWNAKKNRKPLLIRGARQVGKTYVVENFAEKHFDNWIKVDFEERPELKEFFQTSDVSRILQNLELFFGKKISKQNSLLFLDEIQACPEAIKTLRYFYEKIPALRVIAAGSLLDHELNNLKYPMPVGRVEFAYLYPLDFYEFLLALDNEPLVNFLKNYSLGENIPLAVHNKLLEFVRLYYFIGGMPEAVRVYTEENSLTDVEIVHESILKSLEFDFGKYGTRKDRDVLTRLLSYMPRAIGNKFKYSKAVADERVETVKRALNLLRLSRIVHFVYSSSANKPPLSAAIGTKMFKTIFFDIGLANHLLKLRITNYNNLITENEGDLAEQFIGQQLIAMFPEYLDAQLYYWQREKRNAEAEVDYLSVSGNKIIPVEIKAGKTGRLKSLHIYAAEKKIKTAVRFNIDLPSQVGVEQKLTIAGVNKKAKYKLISLPLYLVKEFERFL